MRRMLLALAAWIGLLALPAQARDTVYYYYTDALHSAVVETDAQGNVIERTYYGPYGQVLNRTVRDGPGYTGHQEDAETGLVYMQQRYYDPESGRFLSTDPVQAEGSGGSFNRYWYAKDNPYRYTDPDGRCVDGGGCGAMVQSYAADEMAHPNRPLTPVDHVLLAVGSVVAGVGEADVAVAAVRAVGRLVAEKVAGAAVRRATEGAARNAAIKTTAHGAERLAGDAATRGGVLSADEAKTVMQTGRAMTQADGATVRIATNAAGRSDVVVSGERGIVTTFKNLSEKSVNRLAKRYEWKPPEPKRP